MTRNVRLSNLLISSCLSYTQSPFYYVYAALEECKVLMFSRILLQLDRLTAMCNEGEHHHYK